MPEAGPDDARRIVDKFYMSSFDARLWAPAIEDLKRVLDAPAASLGFFDTVNNSATMLHQDLDRAYADRFTQLWRTNPIFGWMERQAVGSTLSDSTLVERSAFERTTFFNEWARPQGLSTSLFVRLTGSPTAHGQLALIRAIGQPAFGAQEIAFLDRIAVDLVRVMQLRHDAGMRDLGEKLDSLDAVGIGALAVDARCRILRTNGCAGRLLADGAVLRERQRRLVAPARLAGHGLAAAVAVAAGGGRGGDLVLRAPDSDRPACAVSIRPIPDAWSLGLAVLQAALVLVRPAAPPAGRADARGRLMSMFALTPREADLAAALLDGGTLRDAAEGRGISLPTARTQLAQVFRKTGTARQGELVALLLRLLPPD